MNIETLRQMVEGSVIARDEPGYAAARLALIWNGRKPQRFPKVIVKAANVADVQYAVRYAAASGMRLSVRGSGHQFSGIAVQQGVVLDLSAINHIHVDPVARIADVVQAMLVLALLIPPAIATIRDRRRAVAAARAGALATATTTATAGAAA